MRSRNAVWWVGIIFIVAGFTGCGSDTSGIETQADSTGDSFENSQGRIYLSPFPDVGELPRGTSGVDVATGSSFLSANGVKIEGTKAMMDIAYIDPEESETSPPPFAYAVYRFSDVDDKVIGLKIHMNTHNLSPVWIAFANEVDGRWEYPLEPELSSVEVWKSTYDIDFAEYVNDDQLTMAVILADDQESVIVYDVEIITASEVKTFTATSNLDNAVKLHWEAENGAYAFLISRRSSVSGNPWKLLTEEPLDATETGYVDSSAEQGVEYVYSISSAYGPFDSEDNWIWSTGMFVLGRRLVSESGFEFTNSNDLEVQAVNWYNQLGFVGVDTNGNKLLAYQNESFLPDKDWHWHDEGSGISGKVVSWQNNLTQPYTVYLGSQQNNPAITICFSQQNNVYSQVGWIDTAGAITWEAPVQVRDGSYQVIHCFKMSRRLGLLLWNTDEQILEVSDSMDIYGRLWFDIDEWPWEWRSMEGEPPEGSVSSEYTLAGEVVCYKGATTGTTQVYMIANGDWTDYSPNIPCAPGPLYVEMVTEAIVPSSGVVYLTPEQNAIRLVRRQFLDAWDVLPEVEVYTCPEAEQISDFAAYCPASYSGLNFIAWIEDGNVSYSTCNYWDLAHWFNPIVLDESGTCSNLDIIRIGSDDEASYVVYATYLSEDSEGKVKFNFRLLDNRFIPGP